jgi:hypothetical protein
MDETTALLSISKILEEKINHTSNEIFDTYRDKFLMEKINYIIPAVWGTMKDGTLDETQREIYQKTDQLVRDSISAFSKEDLTAPQAFAIRYLVNNTIIFSISYMIEMTKNKLTQGELTAANMLINQEPMGNA